MSKFALLIGVGEYQSAEFQNLAATVRDVAAMRAVLVQPEIGGFAAANVKTLLNPEPQLMREELERLFADRKSDDLLVLYFSGHGVVDDTGKFHLTTVKTNKDLLNSTAIPASFVHGLMEGVRSKSKRQVVILDSCFSGAFAKGMAAKGEAVNLQMQLGGRGRAVLTSSSATEYSFEQKESALSVYTQYLVEGLRTGIADEDGDELISVDELHEFAKAKVREIAPAMKPEIYVVQGGYKIVIAAASTGNSQLKNQEQVARPSTVENDPSSTSPQTPLPKTPRHESKPKEVFTQTPVVARVEKTLARYEYSHPQDQATKSSPWLLYGASTFTLVLFLLGSTAVWRSPQSQPSDAREPSSSIVREPSSQVGRKVAADELLLQAKKKYDKGDYLGVIKDCDQAIRLNSDLADAYNWRGPARQALGDNKGAIADYEEALKLRPDFPQVYNNRGIARSDLGDNQGAITDYDEAIKRAPEFAEAYSNRGSARGALGDKGAISDYSQAIKLKPNYAPAYYNRGNARGALGDRQGAILDYVQVIKLEPNHAHAYYNRGNARDALGDRQGAILDYQKSAELYKQQGKTKDYEMALNEIRKLQ